MALIEDILQDLDEAVLDVGERYFTSTAEALDPTLTIMTTLLVVLIGVTMALGVNRMSMRDAWQLVSRIVLVFIFARSWANFGVIYDALSTGAGSLALSFFNGDTPNPAAAMDQFAVQMSDVADGAARSFSSITRGVVAALLMMILSILMAAYILIVAFSKIMIAFLLGVAPLAMIATIFERTKTLFEAWLTAFVGYLMYPIAAAAVIGAVVSMAAAQFTEQDSLENFSMAIGFLCVAFVGIFALLAIPTAAAHITGSFNLANFAPEALRVVGKTATLPARPVGWVAGRFGEGAKARGEAALSGALTGKSPALAARARDREWAEKGAEWRRKMQGIEIMQGKRP
ncbi:type IV secretion system protein [Paracoccus chinensis]|uniref:TrbL/VirB6 plasmid conjugal transfer protein n=1 Tax=Paracoccus chinensis TaxID=525640 RepID=A0A1G9MSH8_9RHOB|nr:type IV secretion system protein [Paracoccus chinensis]SDL76951.1 TrbL/VirB6 plasmid conjugal transfer protein [Paracoccus chinensis]